MAHLQGIFGLKYSLEEVETIDEDMANIIRNHFKKKKECIDLWLGVEFYGNYDDSVIALIKNDTWYDVMYASSSKMHYDEIEEFFQRNIV